MSGEFRGELLDLVRVSEWQATLNAAGAVSLSGRTFGVQYDINPALIRDRTGGLGREGSYCDHNCTLEHGNYHCDAANTQTVGISRKTLTPGGVILGSLDTIGEGIEQAHTDFFEGGAFDAYCDDYEIPPEVAGAMRLTYGRPGYEVNLFGGNPELHPDIIDILTGLRERDNGPIHLTTTGGRLMTKPEFVKGVVEHSPDILALSADDFEGPEDILALSKMTLNELRDARNAVSPRNGQRRKAHEAIFATRLAEKLAGFPPILYNMVVHDGNVDQIDDIIGTLHQTFPGVRLNPFPAQNAHLYEQEPGIEARHAERMQGFVDHMVDTQTAGLEGGANPYVPRLHYWLILRAAFDTFADQPEQAMRMITGNSIWQCYRTSEAGFYTQVGTGPEGQVPEAGQHPGGHLGCFWNKETVTAEGKVWNGTSDEVVVYIQKGKQELAERSEHKCPGCAFPRLVGHMLSAETGMNRLILPEYLRRRKQTLGF